MTAHKTPRKNLNRPEPVHVQGIGWCYVSPGSGQDIYTTDGRCVGALIDVPPNPGPSYRLKPVARLGYGERSNLQHKLVALIDAWEVWKSETEVPS